MFNVFIPVELCLSATYSHPQTYVQEDKEIIPVSIPVKILGQHTWVHTLSADVKCQKTLVCSSANS